MRKFQTAKASLLTTAVLVATLVAAVAQTSELAVAKRFIRGEQNPSNFQSFVMPLDSQKGIELDPMGDNAAKFPNGTPWFMQIAKEPRNHITIAGPSVNYNFAFENPMVSFGGVGGGTPLYVGQVYKFGFYSGARAEITPRETTDPNSPFYSDLYISAYPKSSFNPSAEDVAPVAVLRVRAPRRNTPEWNDFITKGYQLEIPPVLAGLEIFLKLVESSDPENESWGTTLNSPFVMSVKAGNPDYYFVVESLGLYPLNSTTWYPLTGTIDGSTIIPQLNRLFTLDFEQRPQWRSTFIHQPHFEGEPVPPAYTGKSVEELLAISTPVTKQLGTPSTAYSAINGTPELKRHPILDKFVADMGNDPIALANYVLNQIEITDGIGYNDSGIVTASSINCGGVNRDALATFLEGQGSPVEQSALLVYLLRQAGYPAVYVFPPADGMKMLDTRMSKLLRMQFHGLVNNEGEETVPHLISVNYPWVAVYVPDPDLPGQKKWVHIYPWLKDTEIKEGLNVYDYMPVGYKTGGQWLRKYLLKDNAIVSLSSESDTISTLFPAFIKKQLRDNHSGISFEDLGMKVRDRKNNYADWLDFPQPWSVSETGGNMVVRDKLDSIPNIFDTVSVEVWSDRNGDGVWNSGEKRIQTGEMRSLDVHNRRFILSYKQDNAGIDIHTATLDLASYRPGVSGTGSFGTSDPTWLKKQQASVKFDSNDYSILLKVKYNRQRYLPSSFDAGNRWDNPFGFDGGNRTVEEKMHLSKGDFAAICLNFGRVSQSMVNVHAEEFWAEEKRLRDNPTATGNADIFQGTTAYIMGMSYYEKVARYQRDLMNLHKVNVVSSFASGLAKLGARRNANGTLINTGKIDLVYPVVDMSFKWLAYAGNGTFRPDQGATVEASRADSILLAIGNISAQEHQSINTYFKQFDAVSTVKLLHLTQAAGKPPVELDKNNYTAKGDINYTHNGQTKKLKDWCGTSTWNTIVSGFTGAYSDYTRVFITPGPTAGANGTYRGIGAFVIYPEGGAAYITSNINGGYGYPVPNNSFTTGNYVNLSLSIGLDYTPTMNWSAPSVSAPVVTPSIYNTWNQSNNYNWISTGTSIPTGNQVSAWGQTASYLSYSPPGSGYVETANLYKFTLNTGYAGLPSYYGDGLPSIGQFVGDPVNSVTGEFYIDAVDIKLDGPMPLKIRRNYSSQNVADNEFGYGWKMSYFPYLVMGQGEDVIHAAEMDGSVIVYRKQSSTLWQPKSGDNPHLMNVNGEKIGSLGNILNAKIVKSTSGGNTYYTLTGGDGSVRQFKVQSFPTGGSNGAARQRPYLERWTDNKGNYYAFSFGSDNTKGDYGQLTRIASSNGNFLGFYYDTFGHIIEAYTGDGRRLYYRYDQYGDLIETTLPDGTSIGYDYQHDTEIVGGVAAAYSKHLIIRETKPEGRIIENTYDSKARVTEQRATVGEDMTPVRNASFVYSQTVNSDKTITGNTIIHDAYNREIRYDYVNSKITKITDPLSKSVSYEWYSPTDTSTGAYPSSIKKKVDKRGLVTEYKYDTRGNLIESKLTGDLTGSGSTSTATTTYQYNTRNSLTQTVDSIGKTIIFYENAAYPYAPTTIENYASNTVITKARMAYYNVTSGSTSAYGLLQQETQAFGFPDSATTIYTHNSNGFILSQSRQTGTTDPNVVTDFRYNLRGELIETKDALGRKMVYAYDGLGNKTAEERYNESGKLVAWIYDYYNGNGELEWSDGMRYDPEDYSWKKYDGAGRLIEEIQWRSAVNASGTGVLAPRGDDLYATTFHRYDLFGNRIETRDTRRNTTLMEYDQIGRMLQRKSYEGAATGSLMATESWTYEPGDQIATHINPLGGITAYLYTALGKVAKRTEPDGTVLNWRYYPDGRVQREPVNHNTYWDITYNDVTQTISRVLKTAAGATLKSETKVFDRRGNCISETDGEGNLFTRTYDGLNRVKTEIGPSATGSSAGQSTNYFYDSSGKVTTSTNALGEKNIVTSDILGRTVQVEVRNSSDALIKQSSSAYSADHHSVAVTEGSGTGSITTTTYTDTFGKPVLTIKGDGSKQIFTYDMGGYLISSQDELGQTTAFTYDALNRLRKSTNSDGSVVTLGYDAAGNLTSRQMPGGLTWNAQYDVANRRQNEFLVGGSTTTRAFSYSYNASGIAQGKLQKITDPRGVEHTTTYDAYLRPLTIVSSGGSAPGLTLTYTYDKRDLLTELEQIYNAPADGPPVSISRTYDGYGQPSSEIVKINGQTHSEIALKWDGAGRRSTLNAAGANLPSPLFAYQYRADGKLTLVSTNGENYNFAYGNQGLLASRSNPSRTQSIDQRDGAGRITQQTVTVGSQTPLVETLGWRANSTLSSYSATRNGSGAWNESRAFTYNNRGQLLSEGFSPAVGETKTLNYLFDGGTAGLGVRTSAQVGSGGAADWQWSATQINSVAQVVEDTTNGEKRSIPASGYALGAQSVEVEVDGTTVQNVSFPGWMDDEGKWTASLNLGMGTHSLKAKALHPSGRYTSTVTNTFTVEGANETITNAYDAAGNVISRTWLTGKAQTLTWDTSGRLIKVVQRDNNGNGFDWSAVYDAMGRRLKTTEQQFLASVSTGSANVIASTYDPTVEFLEIGISANGQKAWKVYGPDASGTFGSLQGIGGLEAVIVENSTTFGTINDFWGDAVASVSAGTMTFNETRVAGYGPLPGMEAKLLTAAENAMTSTVWKGKRLDPTGFYYLGARYYEPTSGRFLSPDPLGHAASLSLYDYANGDPVNGIDPDGRYATQIPSYTGDFKSPLPLMSYIPNSNELFKAYYPPSEIRGWINDAANYNQIPPLMLATILQQENSPYASTFRQAGQYSERVLTTGLTTADSILFDLVPNKVFGYNVTVGSAGFANMSRPTLENAASYIESTYNRPPMPFDVQYRAFGINTDSRIPGYDWKTDLYYASAHIRQLVDQVTNQTGFDANQLTLMQAQLVFQKYNGSGEKAEKYGRDAIKKIQRALDGSEPLYFFEK